MPILKLFEKQKEITRNDVEEALGVGTTHAANILNEMLAKDLIKKWVAEKTDEICGEIKNNFDQRQYETSNNSGFAFLMR